MNGDKSLSNLRLTSFSPTVWTSGNRSMNASSSERSLLLGVISSRLSILDARDNDSRSLRQKSILWEHITRQFNSLNPTPRSRHQIQTLYKNMKAKAKKYQMRVIEAKMDSFTNALPEPDPVSELLLQLLENEQEHRRQQLKQTALNIAEGRFCNDDELEEGSDNNQKFYNLGVNNVGEAGEDTTTVKNENTFEESEIELGDSSNDISPKNHYDISSKNNDDISHENNHDISSKNHYVPTYVNKHEENDNDFKENNGDSSCSNISATDVTGGDVIDTDKVNGSYFTNTPSAKRQKTSDHLSSTPCDSPSFKISTGYKNMSKMCVNSDNNFNHTCFSCCRELHLDFYQMATKEHEERMKIMRENQKMKLKVYEEKIKLIQMEKEVQEKRLNIIEKFDKQEQNENNQTRSLNIGEELLENVP